MLGKRTTQGSLFTPENRLRRKLGEESFYVFLADHRHELFRDEDFATLYCGDNGRPSVPPSLLACALLLQTFNSVSDQEATDRAAFDQRWQFALGIADDEVPFAKSTLCLFRNQLIIHKEAKLIFHKGIGYLRSKGFAKAHKMTVALDTTPIFGKGAVQDTFNMLSEGLRQVLRVVALLQGRTLEELATAEDFSRYVAPSFKGTWAINWDNEHDRQVVLETLVADCHHVLALAGKSLSGYTPDSAQAKEILQASDLLQKLLVQDVRRSETGAAELIQGVAQDRIVSVHDPEMRHGRKSSSQRFDGYKGALAVETDTQIITAVDVIPGNAHDNVSAPGLIQETKATTGAQIHQVIGDGAYGSAEARLDAQQNQYNLVAPVAESAHTGRFRKEDFAIDLERMCVTCPAGETTSTHYKRRKRTQRGTVFQHKSFTFSLKQCRDCKLRAQCLMPTTRQRGVLVHEQEALLQQARDFQRTEQFRAAYHLRVTVEHRIARLMRLGARQARYFGSSKVLFQLAMAASVANLTLFANMGRTSWLFLPMLTIWLVLTLDVASRIALVESTLPRRATTKP